MNAPRPYDVAIIGGGIVGLATARALLEERSLSLLVLEGEKGLAQHQTGHNSGVIHSGLYYKPGSLKAQNCVGGRDAMYRFCEEQGIAHERCGKVVVATNPGQVPALDELERRGSENGLKGLRRLSAEEICEYEPHVVAVDGLLVPETGIVDFTQVAEAYARGVREAGGEIRLGHRVRSAQPADGAMVLVTDQGEVRARNLVNCGGLQSDEVARMCGMEPGLRIIPFRGEYYVLKPEKHGLVRNLIYPVPDPRFPFLGVHFTRMIHGGVEAGPNAVLAFKREGYGWSDFSASDTLQMFAYPGFWRMARKYWKTGIAENVRSLSKAAFVRALQGLIPELEPGDVEPGGAGVRAQAVEPDGALVDDFRIVESERMIHVLNAPSPAATASISIGKSIASMAKRRFGLGA